MKNSKTKIKRLRSIQTALRKLDQAIFDLYELALTELDQAMWTVEQELLVADLADENPKLKEIKLIELLDNALIQRQVDNGFIDQLYR